MKARRKPRRLWPTTQTVAAARGTPDAIREARFRTALLELEPDVRARDLTDDEIRTLIAAVCG